MSFLLKIVEGPNKGAEIALVEGVEVTLGKNDECDIILADSSLPAKPISISADGAGVKFDGEALAPFHVTTIGATSLAIGPADAPWGELVWPGAEKNADGEETKDAPKPVDTKAEEVKEEKKAEPEEEEKPARFGCFGCLIAAAIVLLLLICLAWFLRATLEPKVKNAWSRFGRDGTKEVEDASIVKARTLKQIAEKYNLELEEEDGVASIAGNLATRRERLAATAEIYAAAPGTDVDLSDDESFRVAVEDALFTLTEGALKAAAVSNRVVAISGTARSPIALKKILEALNADLPKLRNVDVAQVGFGPIVRSTGAQSIAELDANYDYIDDGKPETPKSSKPEQIQPELPVCGILTTPYPCLVMKNGSRILEGASVGSFTIEKIEADSVIITNSTGSFTWKP